MLGTEKDRKILEAKVKRVSVRCEIIISDDEEDLIIIIMRYKAV